MPTFHGMDAQSVHSHSVIGTERGLKAIDCIQKKIYKLNVVIIVNTGMEHRHTRPPTNGTKDMKESIARTIFSL